MLEFINAILKIDSIIRQEWQLIKAVSVQLLEQEKGLVQGEIQPILHARKELVLTQLWKA